MKNGFENIKEVLLKYFEGDAEGDEKARAEKYLMAHPEIMEKYEEIWGLCLHPADDSSAFRGVPLKSPAELDDNQFMLLAAASAENDLGDEELSDFESVLESDPVKKSIAAEFGNLKLKPMKDNWSNRNRMLRTTPFASFVRKGAIATLAAAAIVLAIVFPGIFRKEMVVPAGQALSLANKDEAATVKTEKKIAEEESQFIVRSFPPASKTVAASHVTVNTAREESQTTVTEREEQIGFINGPLPMPQIAYTEPSISKVSFTVTTPGLKIKEDYGNWMLNGLNSIAMALSQERVPRDNFTFAGERINDINKLLGWNMQLDQKKDENGELLALNFRSNLVSFSKPVKKNNERQ